MVEGTAWGERRRDPKHAGCFTYVGHAVEYLVGDRTLDSLEELEQALAKLTTGGRKPWRLALHPSYGSTCGDLVEVMELAKRLGCREVVLGMKRYGQYLSDEGSKTRDPCVISLVEIDGDIPVEWSRAPLVLPRATVRHDTKSLASDKIVPAIAIVQCDPISYRRAPHFVPAPDDSAQRQLDQLLRFFASEVMATRPHRPTRTEIPDEPLVIVADRWTQFARIMYVAWRCADPEVRIRHIALATRRPGREAPPRDSSTNCLRRRVRESPGR